MATRLPLLLVAMRSTPKSPVVLVIRRRSVLVVSWWRLEVANSERFLGVGSVLRGGSGETDAQLAVNMQVRVCPGTQAESRGAIVEDFGEIAAQPVDLGGKHFADPARQWAVQLDTGDLVFVDIDQLVPERSVCRLDRRGQQVGLADTVAVVLDVSDSHRCVLSSPTADICNERHDTTVIIQPLGLVRCR
jgi:hypothetical protein